MVVIGSRTPEDLISGKFPIVDAVRLIPAGTPAFKRGAILTAANAPVNAGGTPDCIALQDADASAGEARCVVALSGGFNVNFLSTGDGSDPAAFEANLRGKSIYLTQGLIDGAPAVWKIVYVLDGGTNGANPAQYAKADLPITLEAATKASKTFGGWFDNSGFTGDAITHIPAGTEGDITLYAKFT
jgi:uncharacterized repeat protein (TIGR02543 family)